MEAIKAKLIETLTNLGYKTIKGMNFSECNLGGEYNLYLTIYADNESQHGMQLMYTKETGMYEISEYMAGPNEDQLFIYTETKRVDTAVKSLLKGNLNRTPIKIW